MVLFEQLQNKKYQNQKYTITAMQINELFYNHTIIIYVNIQLLNFIIQ